MSKTKKQKYNVKARRFYLLRTEDVSGVSGTGAIAEGLMFDSGMCVLSFNSQYQHCNVYANLHALEQVHGHNGTTVVIFVDGE